MSSQTGTMGRRAVWRAWLGAGCAMLAAVAAAGEASAAKRRFTVLAVEPKGGVTQDKEAFPASALPTGGGYVLSAPAPGTGRWEVSAYVWAPAQIVVEEGDEVTLEFVGVNGAAHPTTITALGKSFDLKRGEAQSVTFVADKVGAFGIVCATHQPSMNAEIVVLPKR